MQIVNQSSHLIYCCSFYYMTFHNKVRGYVITGGPCDIYFRDFIRSLYNINPNNDTYNASLIQPAPQ